MPYRQGLELSDPNDRLLILTSDNRSQSTKSNESVHKNAEYLTENRTHIEWIRSETASGIVQCPTLTSAQTSTIRGDICWE